MDLPPAPPTLTDDPPPGGGDVVLRAHRPDDAARAFESAQDPAFQRWTSVPVPPTLENAVRFVGEVMPGAWTRGESWGFALEHDGRFAGTLELRPDEDRAAGVAEVAYGSHPDVRGRGVMERALRLLLEWGFDHAGLHTVWWRAHVGNWASRRLAWKVGFRVEGTVRSWVTQRGERHDAWVGSLLREDLRQPAHPWYVPRVLAGERARLRPLRTDDVPRIVEACSDPTTQHFLGRMPSPYGEADAREWLEQSTEQQASGRGLTWAVADPDTDLLAGAMNVFDLTPGKQCEIGYWAHPATRGRGLTTDGMGLAMRYAFGALGVQRVLAGAAVDNAASRRVIEANGLRQWGVERGGTTLRDGPADCAFYDVTLAEWTDRQRRAVAVPRG